MDFAAYRADPELLALEAALATEPRLGRRLELEEARLDRILRCFTAAQARAVERVRAEARADGWASARAMLGARHDLDLPTLAQAAQALLRETAAPDLGEGVLARHDLPRARRDGDPERVVVVETRLLAAGLLHDLDLLDEGPVVALRERYARRMAVASGLSWPSAAWLADADPLLRRAAALDAALRPT